MRRLCLIPLLRMINGRIIGCQIELNILTDGPEACGQAEKHQKSARPLLPQKDQFGVVDPGDLVEDPALSHSAVRHQEMKVRVKIDAVAEGLDGGDNPGHQLASGQHFGIF